MADRILRVLIVEDVAADYRLLSRYLQREVPGAQITWVRDFAAAEVALASGGWDVVLSDYHVPGGDFREFVGHVSAAWPDLPLILVSGTIGEEQAVELVRSGLSRFVLKDNLTRLPLAIDLSLREAKLDRARREAEERFQLALAAADEGVWEHDLATGAGFLSDRVYELLGLAPGEVPPHPDSVIQRLDDADRVRVEAQRTRLLSGEIDRYSCEVRATHQDGHPLELRLNVTLSRDDAGRPQRLVGTISDITERRRTERALAASEARLRQAVRGARCLLWTAAIHVVDGLVATADPGAYVWSIRVEPDNELPEPFAFLAAGQSSGTPALQHLNSLVPSAERAAKDAVAADAFSAGLDHYAQEFRCVDPAGQEHWLREEVSLEPRGPGRWQAVGVWVDVTERRLAGREREELARQRQLALDAAHLGWWRYDPLSGTAEWDDGYRRIFGVTGHARPNDEILAELIHPDDRPALWASVEAALNPRAPRPFEAEYRIRRASDGRERWIEAHGVATFEGDGVARRAVDLVGTVEDITERKQAAEALRASEAQLSTALAMARAGHWEYDVDSDTFTFNDNFCRIFRTTAEEVGGYTMSAAEYARQFCHPDDVALVATEVQAAIDTTDPHYSRQLEHRFVYADGEVGHLLVRLTIVKDAAGRTVRWYGVNQDITDRKRDEQQLASQAQVIESVGQAVHIDDADGRIVYTNAAFDELLGYQRGELLGHGAIEINDLTEPAWQSHRERVRAALATTGVWSGELVKQRKDGTRFISDARVYALPSLGAGYTVTMQEEATSRTAMVHLLTAVGVITDLHDLMQAVTNLVRDDLDFEAVGVRLQDGDDFPYYQTSGFPTEFVQLETHLCARDASGQTICDTTGLPVLDCMCGQVLRGEFDPSQPFFTARGSFWANDTSRLLATTTAADRGTRTRNRCNGEGYESVGLFALRTGGETFGLLQCNDRRPGRFTPERLALLERIADTLAAALAHLRSQSALATSEAHYRLLAEHADDLVTMSTCDGQLLYCSPSYERVTGWTTAELLAGSPGSLNHPDELDAVRAARQANLRGEATDLEYRLRCKDGRWLWLAGHCRPVLDAAGRVAQLILWSRDITQQKLAAQALEESERRYRTLIEGAAEGILAVEPESGRIYFTNPAVCELLGYSAAELADLVVSDLFPPSERDATLALFDEAVRNRSGATPNVALMRRDGQLVRVDTTYTTLELDGRSCLLGFLTDVTQRQHEAAERASLQAQLAQAQKLEAVGRLAAGIAHDFNNMLAVIQGHSQLALDDLPVADPMRDDLEAVIGAAQRSAELTRQLLTFSRQQPATPISLDLGEQVSGMRKLLGRLIGDDIELVVHLAPDVWTVRADPTQVDQILANLAVNARDAMPDCGTLTIAAHNDHLDADGCLAHPAAEPGDYVCLAVTDDGCGMDEATVSHVFEPFFTTKPEGRGTGLGLATVYGILQQHHGAIAITSVPEAGTTVRVWLPRDLAAVTEVTGGGEAAVAGGHETILLVEDQPHVLGLVAMMLERLGYEVLTASTPAAALELAAAPGQSIDAVVTDVVMPGMSGRQMMARLTALRPDLRALYMSGYPARPADDEPLLPRGEAFLQKPFTREALGQALRDLLEQP